jgi:polysaccharide biosynthesis transport protein
VIASAAAMSGGQEMSAMSKGPEAFEVDGQHSDAAEILHGWARLLRRYFLFLLFVTFGGAVLFYAAAALIVPRYKADAVLVIGGEEEKATNIGDAKATTLYPELPEIEARSQMLQSPDLALHVIDQLGLRNDEEFNRPTAGWIKRIASASTMAVRALAWWSRPVSDAAAPPSGPQPIDDPVVRQFLDQLRVSPLERSFAISVEFSAENPYRAAQVANVVAETFIGAQLEARRQMAKEAASWLTRWVGELKTKLTSAERAVEEYREQAGITRTKDKTVPDQQLSDLNSQLVGARVDRMRLEAQLEHLTRSTEDGVQASSEVLSSQLIQTLRAEESALMHRAAELSSHFGPRYPAIIAVDAAIGNVRVKIRNEVSRLAEGLRKQAEIARSREQQLEESVREAEHRSGILDKASVRLHQLEQEAEAVRSLYGASLSRIVELRLQQESASSDVRIAAKAVVPEAPYFPKKAPAVAVGAIGFFLLGIGFVNLREKMARGFVSSDQIHRITGLPVIAMLPRVCGRTTRGTDLMLERHGDRFFREGLSNLYAAMPISGGARRVNNIVLVTSSVPGEGKSFLSTALATRLAQSGHRCLLIDCDLRLPTTHSALRLRGDHGLLQYLTNDTPSYLPIQAHASGLDLIASGTAAPELDIDGEGLPERLPALLKSPKLQTLLRTMSEQYDVVIIDSPPVLGTCDARVLAGFASWILYVVRWRETARNTVISGLQKMIGASSAEIGVVLSQVDAQRYAAGDSLDAEIYARQYRRYLKQA